MNLTENQIAEFNQYYQDACKKQEGIIILEGYRPNKLGFFEKIRAKKAIALFEKAFAIYPESFQCLFFIGKIYQRLGDYKKSLDYFEAAMEIEKENHNLPQEASIVAMHLNKIDKAIKYSEESIKRKPDDFAVLGNHSMNLLIAGQDLEALQAIENAISINPNDEINNRIKTKIKNVIAGKEKRPTFESSLE